MRSNYKPASSIQHPAMAEPILGPNIQRFVLAQRRTVLLSLIVCACGLVQERPVLADTNSEGSSEEFVARVGPLLERHCLRCHGREKAAGGLRLDSAEHFHRGGDSGPTVVPGNSAQSELIRRLLSKDEDLRMPQAAGPLSAAEVEQLRRWIDAGARWPQQLVLQDVSRRHWSFQPPRPVAIPDVAAWSKQSRNAIDSFVLRRLHQEQLGPSPPADRVTLIRRVTLDLIGLPPTPREVANFAMDQRPDAYERLVARLLASPHYGEKWARPWLDLCHYAESDGYLTDQLRPVAWRYRHWLVDALNRNLPYDQMTIEQLAGDLLPQASMEQKIATGFLRQTLSNREGGADLEEFRVKQVVDRTTIVGSVWLGLTVGCARCHDHKYDPLSQREFFELYACLNNGDEVNIDAPLPAEREAYDTGRGDYWRQRQQIIAPWLKDVHELQRRWEAKLLHAWRHPGQDHTWDRQWEVLGLVWGGGLGEGQLEGTEIVKLSWDRRTARQQADLLDYFLRRGAIVDGPRFKSLRVGELASQLEKLKGESPSATRAPTMQAALTRRPTLIHRRGEFRDPGAQVEPATPSCLNHQLPADDLPRLALAKWLVSPKNPLTARVTVNRMWQEFFGRGLVLTSEDFGTRGAHPSHPDLLDWLATRFVEGGWDVKTMHRLIVTSATYRQSSPPRPELSRRDPDNVLLARQASLRVPAETVRDLALAASGLLCANIGGPSVKPPQPERVTMEAFGNNKWLPSPGGDRYRRAIYTVILRASPFAQSVTFDAPNPNEVCTRRVRSNTPLQALTLLNDPVFYEMAEALAGRVLAAEFSTDEQRIDYAFRCCCARAPRQDEVQLLMNYLRQQANAVDGVEFSSGSQQPTPNAARWTNLCSVILNLHEFITRD